MTYPSKREAMLFRMLTTHRERRRNTMARMGMGWEKENAPVWRYHDWAMIWERQLEAAYMAERHEWHDNEHR